MKNRMRLVFEVIQRIKEYVGSGIAVGIQLTGDEKLQGGNTPQDSVEIAIRLDGKVDWITAAVGHTLTSLQPHVKIIFRTKSYRISENFLSQARHL